MGNTSQNSLVEGRGGGEPVMGNGMGGNGIRRVEDEGERRREEEGGRRGEGRWEEGGGRREEGGGEEGRGKRGEGRRRKEGRREEGRKKEGRKKEGRRVDEGGRRKEGGERHSPITYMYHQIDNRIKTPLLALLSALTSYSQLLHCTSYCALLQVITVWEQGRPGNEANQCWRFDVNKHDQIQRVKGLICIPSMFKSLW